MVILRNRYNYIPVVVQQQSSEVQGLEAFKANKIRPTVAALADSKYTGRDASVMLGITNPNSFDLPDYMGYPIKDTFRGNIRFLEVVINRNGNANGICPLFFDGAINDFKELPLPSEREELDRIIQYVRKLREPKQRVSVVMFLNTVKKSLKKLRKKSFIDNFASHYYK